MPKTPPKKLWLNTRFPADRVTGYAFTRQSKAKLGSNFIAVVETGRFRYWKAEDQAEAHQPSSDGWWFFRQAEACTYHLPPGGIFDQHLQWGVPSSAKISVPYGLADALASARANAPALAIHDDRLLSAALVAVYDDLYTIHLRLGRAHSAIIPAQDPLNNLTF